MEYPPLRSPPDEDAESLQGIDVSSSQQAANDAIAAIDDAIVLVSAERSKLGAMQNRLEHTIANLGTAAENLQAAESRIRDLDMAEEIMVLTKNNILQQAATAMLAQANMAPPKRLTAAQLRERYNLKNGKRSGGAQRLRFCFAD